MTSLKTLIRVVKDLTGARSNSTAPVHQRQEWESPADTRGTECTLGGTVERGIKPAEPLITFVFDTLSIPKDLPINTAITTEEKTERAIKALKNNKSAGLDEISAELLKHGGPP